MSVPTFNPELPDESHTYKMYTTLAILTVAFTTTTALRIIGKLKHKLAIRAEDYLILFATIFNIIAATFDYEATVYGMGRHVQYLTLDQAINTTKYAQLGVCIDGIIIACVKCSICFFLLGIITKAHRRFTIGIWTLMGFTVATTFIAELLWGLQARPFPKLWDPRIAGTRWSDQRIIDVVYVFQGINIITDVVYALSPLYFLWNVKIGIRRKITLVALTTSGILLAFVACLIISFAREFLSEDPTWTSTNLYICNITERSVSGVVANLPVLWTVFTPTPSKPNPQSPSQSYSSSPSPLPPTSNPFNTSPFNNNHTHTPSKSTQINKTTSITITTTNLQSQPTRRSSTTPTTSKPVNPFAKVYGHVQPVESRFMDRGIGVEVMPWSPVGDMERGRGGMF